MSDRGRLPTMLTLGVLTMPPDVRQIFIEAPEDEPRSRLEPYRAQILRWRNQGRSYRRIQKLLSENCEVRVAYESLRQFVQRRSRPRKVQPEVGPEISQMELGIQSPDQPRRKLTLEERMAQAELLRAIRNKPVVMREPVKPRFEYDPDKPLTLDRTIKD